MNEIITVHSCADKSKGRLRVVHNPENNVTGVFLRDDDGDSYLVTITDADAVAMAQKILKEVHA